MWNTWIHLVTLRIKFYQNNLNGFDRGSTTPPSHHRERIWFWANISTILAIPYLFWQINVAALGWDLSVYNMHKAYTSLCKMQPTLLHLKQFIAYMCRNILWFGINPSWYKVGSNKIKDCLWIIWKPLHNTWIKKVLG